MSLVNSEMRNASSLGACIYNTETSLIRAQARQGLPLTPTMRVYNRRVYLPKSLLRAQEDADKEAALPGHRGRARWLRTYNQLHIRHKTVPHAALAPPLLPHAVPTHRALSRDAPTNPFLPFALSLTAPLQ